MHDTEPRIQSDQLIHANLNLQRIESRLFEIQVSTYAMVVALAAIAIKLWFF